MFAQVHLCWCWLWGPPIHYNPTLERKSMLYCCHMARKRQIQDGNQEFSGFFSGDHPRNGKSSSLPYTRPPLGVAVAPWRNLKKTGNAWVTTSWGSFLPFWCSVGGTWVTGSKATNSTRETCPETYKLLLTPNTICFSSFYLISLYLDFKIIHPLSKRDRRKRFWSSLPGVYQHSWKSL